MVLKAMDMQVLVPRSHDVGKIQQLQLQQQANQNHNTGVELQKNFSIQQSAVNKLDSMINENIRDNRKGKNNSGSPKEKNSNESDTSEEEITVVSHLGTILDIHI